MISRQISWQFFGKELMLIINTNSNNCVWLQTSKNYHILAQLNHVLYTALLHMINDHNNSTFTLKDSTLHLFKHLINTVFGPMQLLKVGIRVGDVKTVNQVIYSKMLCLCAATNRHHYLNLIRGVKSCLFCPK